MSFARLPKAATPVLAKELAQLSCLAVYCVVNLYRVLSIRGVLLASTVRFGKSRQLNTGNLKSSGRQT